MTGNEPVPRENADDFTARADAQAPGLLHEFAGFLLASKKWWLIPIIIALLFVGALVFLGGTPVAPFIYTLF